MSGAEGAGEAFAELVAVMDRLRHECAWKRAQTHASLARYLLEETHETIEAIESPAYGSDSAALREELGDLLLQVVFHARVAEESPEGRVPFDAEDVVRGITAKLLRRNPHVFGPDAGAADAPRDPEAVNDQWEAVKAAEKPRKGIADGIAPTLPALATAQKLHERLVRAGASTDVAGDGVGERLWRLVGEAAADGTDPEQALRAVLRTLAER